MGRRAKLSLGLVGDIGATIEALLPKLATKTVSSFLDHSVARYKSAREGFGHDLARGTPWTPADPSAVPCKGGQRSAADDAVFTFDVGTPTIWAARYLRMNGRRRMVGSLVHGSMANAMPQAIGPRRPARPPVVSLSGDGGFSMFMGDLITLEQGELPVKVVIFNNGVLGFEPLEMKAAGYVETATIWTTPISRRWHAPSQCTRDATRIPATCRRPSTPCWPMTAPPSRRGYGETRAVHAADHRAEQVKEFSLWVLRAVMSGRGDEVIDLAKTNSQS